MCAASTADVKAMYSKYPYPSPTVGGSLSFDVANLFRLLCGPDDFAGKKILDAGCGTSQRVLGFAKRYPKAKFQGIDMTTASLNVARQLALRHNVQNITFKERNILELDLGEKFDIIVSTGVLHHLTDPQKGVSNLCKHLSDDGVICLWYYHPFGEAERLMDRELLLTLWDPKKSDLLKGQWVMEQLGLGLIPGQYGMTATQKERDRSQLSINADAFMHPIVNAYRFDEAMAMFKPCGVQWVAIAGYNTANKMKLIDLEEAGGDGSEVCLFNSELFKTDHLINLYKMLPKVEQLKIIELITKPTGFTILAGRGDSYKKLGSRTVGNMIPMEDVPDPYPRVYRV